MASRAWRPNSRRWQIAPPYEGAADLARRLGTTSLVAQVLHNRGIDEAEAGTAFLNPKLTDLHDPGLLAGAEAAAQRIARAVADRERILIYGDYDVDGITGVAILHALLSMLDADVHYYIPHRIEEGYGVNIDAVRKLTGHGAKLLITVDCGIGAVEPLAAAAAAGLDVIITDHHSPPETLPQAVAIVHPSVPPGSYPNVDLAGAGVAFKLAWQVAKAISGPNASGRVDGPMRDFLLDATCLAALGTIADVVPLLGENRVLAVYGLRGLPATKHVGLRALIASARLTGEKLDAYHVGFVLAPRLNACGRMGHAQLAVELLTNAPEARAKKIADYLAKQNTKRQRVERAITEQAVEMIETRGLDDPANRAIVLACEDWHSGVIGIVASRIVGRYHRPAVLIAVNAAGGQGSARSIAGFNMRDALEACGEHLISFGGHAMAGGLRIEQGKIDTFSEAMLQYAGENISDQQLT
ncbi:MAG: single-stranded-DNA-specific exonuclease RecJ, partial [Phycisphaerae bacterium]|nr:single-stranded-DNA-specific exonuclease RecJ [Phycisphaerae bacterium]